MEEKSFNMTRMNQILERVGGTNKKEDNTRGNLSMKDLLSITRKLNEQEEDVDTSTEADFEYEKMKAEKFLDGMALRFTDKSGKPYFKKTKNKIIWGGVVNGIIRFIFIVEEDKSKSKVVFDYTEDFSPDNPENDEIIKKIELYYDSFYDRWIDKINT